QPGLVKHLSTSRHFVPPATEQAATGAGIAVLAAHRGARGGDFARVVEADRAVLHRKLNEEMRTMTVRMGRKLAEMAVRVLAAPGVGDWLAAIKRGETPGTYPVGQARVFPALGLAAPDAFPVHQYGAPPRMLAP